MALTFSKIRSAIDILRWRLPGALAMLRASDASISFRHCGTSHSVTVTYHFEDGGDSQNAYRACERLYGFDQVQRESPARRGSQDEEKSHEA